MIFIVHHDIALREVVTDGSELVRSRRSLLLCLFEELAPEAHRIVLLRLQILGHLELDLLGEGDALSDEPICGFVQRMVRDQVLHEHVLLAAEVHGADTSAAARQLMAGGQEALEALIAARAEAAGRESGALEQAVAQLALERWRDVFHSSALSLSHRSIRL